ncbi:MAG: hypothetical protein O4749_07565, partial [Trichodesmium sp. St5_bin2_1]|nr:hypothetical protein [Trichodesmium sp. St5_bin2_1]
ILNHDVNITGLDLVSGTATQARCPHSLHDFHYLPPTSFAQYLLYVKSLAFLKNISNSCFFLPPAFSLDVPHLSHFSDKIAIVWP